MFSTQLFACSTVGWTAKSLLQFNISMSENTTMNSFSLIHFYFSRCLKWFQFIEPVHDALHWMKIRIIISFPFILITVVDGEILQTYIYSNEKEKSTIRTRSRTTCLMCEYLFQSYINKSKHSCAPSIYLIYSQLPR